MKEVEKDGILVDICPSCKGVWLDRGELEKLMKDVREVRQDYNEWYYAESEPRQPAKPPQVQAQQPYYGSHPQGHSQGQSQGHPHGRKKKKSVLDVFGDLFD
jgi:Zn-finger nucleic acid-binding protein